MVLAAWFPSRAALFMLIGNISNLIREIGLLLAKFHNIDALSLSNCT